MKIEPMEALMTLEEVAGYFRLSKDTVYRMAQAGKIPAFKAGNQWRFRKEDMDAWIEENKVTENNESIEDQSNSVKE